MGIIERFKDPEWELQSAYKQTSVHELIHQLGDLDDSEHYRHSGANANTCALWPISHFDTLGVLENDVQYFRICDDHIGDIRTNLTGTLLASGQSKIVALPFPIRTSTQKYGITMSLPKKVYKKFEPVVARFELINKDDKPINIRSMFNPEMYGETRFRITDDMGNQWGNVNHTIGDETPLWEPYVVQPGDTFVISMPINSWAERSKHGQWYLGQLGHFLPERTYKASFYNNNFGITSNEVEFQVTDLTDEDKTVLSPFADAFYDNDSLAQVYPTNAFAEHIIAYSLYLNYAGILNGREVKPELIEKYLAFFEKYPDTYYMYYDNYMLPLYVKLFMGKDNYAQTVAEIKKQTTNGILIKFLSDNKVQNRIARLVKMVEDNIGSRKEYYK